MSKVGNKPISVEQGVEVVVDGSLVKVTGPRGSMEITLPNVLQVAKTDGGISLSRSDETKHSKSLHGTFRSLIWNAVHGVTKGWEKRVEVVGTGFGVTLKGKDAVFKVGYSHPVVFPHVEGLEYSVDGGTILVISGIDRQQVGEIAHLARSLKKPDPYKGKGVRYVGETIKLRPGKKTKTA